jgi:putative intracellular protease/amidase
MCKNSAMTVPRRHRVVVLLLEPAIGYDAVIPVQLLGEATDDQGRALYDVTMASLDGGPVRTSSGYQLVPQDDASALRTADTVIVPGTQLPGPRRDGTIPVEVADALRSVRRGARLVSICTGAFVLAAGGWLDGRPATTHWKHADDLGALYPDVLLDPDVLFTDDGDVLTSAGLSAGVDLCLHLIRIDHGSEVANRVARYCVVPPWRDGGQGSRPGLGAGAPGGRRAGAGPAGRYEPAHLRPPLPRGDRAVARRLAHPAAGASRPAPPRGDRPRRRRGGGARRDGHVGLAPRPSAQPARGVSRGIPPDLPRVRQPVARRVAGQPLRHIGQSSGPSGSWRESRSSKPKRS